MIAFTDSYWQDCPDTGRSTSGYKIFMQGGIIDAQSTLNAPIALSSAEAEYMGACNCATMLCYLRELWYDFNYLGMSCSNIEEIKDEPPSIMMVDNHAMVKMSKSITCS